MQRLRREIKAWKQLDHENIIKVLGTVSDFGPMTSIVYPWAEFGTLTKHLEVDGPEITIARRFEIVSLFASERETVVQCSSCFYSSWVWHLALLIVS